MQKIPWCNQVGTPAGLDGFAQPLELDNGEDIEGRPDEVPDPARLVLGLCRLGALHVAFGDNIVDDEIIVKTADQPDPVLWEPDFKTRRTSR